MDVSKLWQQLQEAYKGLTLAQKFGGGLLALALIIGVMYYQGYSAGVTDTQVADQSAAQHTVQIVTKEVDKIQTKIVAKYIHDIRYVEENNKNNEVIIQNNLPDTFILSSGFVYSYNSSLQGAPDEPSRVADATSSGITAISALKTITENNTACKLNVDQLKDLQAYINSYNAAIEKVNTINNR